MQNTLLAPPKATPHPEWCAKHDTDGDVCFSAHVDLDFTIAGRIHSDGYAALGHAPEEGTDITVYFSGLGAAYMGLDSAENLAMALLALVAAGRRGGAL